MLQMEVFYEWLILSESFLSDDLSSSFDTILFRQLEAIVRISESLAKMRLQPFATETDVDEALRLFQVSTLDAAMSGGLSGAEGFTPEEELAEVRRVEAALKKRFAIGSQVGFICQEMTLLFSVKNILYHEYIAAFST